MSDFCLALRLLKQGKMTTRCATKDNRVVVNRDDKLYRINQDDGGERLSYESTNIDLFAEDWIEWVRENKKKQ